MIKRIKKISSDKELSNQIINDKTRGLDRVTEIINRLVDKENGCPWDIIQTNKSLAKHTIEEAYELADSIETESPEETCQELGDLLFNVLFHIQVAEQENFFSLDDVIEQTVKKMVSRHPHVFNEIKKKSITEVNEQWEQIKRKEKKIDPHGRIEKEFDSIASNIPALTYASKVQKKAAAIGFDWDASFEIINKIYEEIDEFIEAEEQENSSEQLEEFGDILFSVVNLGRYKDIDPETALRSTNRKFVDRLSKIERLLNDRGEKIKNTSKKELNLLWQKIKHGQ
jgi:ATP diphosphatase